MKRITFFALFFVVMIFGYAPKIFAVAVAPYNSVEEAVRASGGTYGTIDTTNPDAANNFVQTIVDQGLTNSDGSGECTSMNIRPGVKISCALSVNKDAYYHYEGKKGEKVTVTVSATNFVPEIDISDANGGMEFFDNKQKQNFLTVTKTLSYTGKYTFEVKTRYNSETKEREPFTVSLTSDKSNIQPDIRRDLLVEGKKYSIYELNQNQSTTARKFFVDAYVLSIYKAPECPPKAYSCKISLPPNITIGDTCAMTKVSDACNGKKSDIVLYLDANKKYTFQVGKKYQFEVSVKNTSKTNIPKNGFDLVSVTDLNGENIATSTPMAIVDKPVKASIFVRFTNWFWSLFK